jgi:calcium binding protein 39
VQSCCNHRALSSYENADMALHCGMMLRDCARHEPLMRVLFATEYIFKFFDYVELPAFDVSSDAFSTFKELLTTAKPAVAEFLEVHYEKVRLLLSRKTVL